MADELETTEMDVLIKGVLSADGRTVRIAPGVELSPESVEIIQEVPPVSDFPVVMFFHSEDERQEFAARFRDHDTVDLRHL